VDEGQRDSPVITWADGIDPVVISPPASNDTSELLPRAVVMAGAVMTQIV
jgi:hypothetical protein